MSNANKTENHPVSEKDKFRVLLTASAVSALIMLDSNIVAVSLPSIARSLNATFADIEWVVSAYVLAFASLLLAAGSLADRHGRKLATVVGLVIFVVASVLCGLSTSPVMLNLARALQGVGAALLLTAAMAIISHTFSGKDRAKAYGFWGACLGIAIASGPIAGGLITETLGWRWAFLINLPVGAILLVATLRVLKESADPESKQLDIAGIFTFSLGLFLLIWAVIDGNAVGWRSQPIVERFLASAILFVVFVVVELRQRRPMVDLSLFKESNFLGTTFAMLGYSGGAQVMIFYLPMFLQNAYGLTPAKAGIAMLPFALPMFLTPRLGAKLATRYSSRELLMLGLAVTLAGDVLLFGFSHFGASYPLFAIGMAIVGSGAGLLNGETSKAMQGAVPPQRSGMASGLTSTVRFGGLLLAVAGLGATLSLNISKQFVAAATALGLDPRVASVIATRVASGDIRGAFSGFPESVHTHLVVAASTAFANGFAAASVLAALVTTISLTLSYCLLRRQERVSLTTERALEVSSQIIE